MSGLALRPPETLTALSPWHLFTVTVTRAQEDRPSRVALVMGQHNPLNVQIS